MPYAQGGDISMVVGHAYTDGGKIKLMGGDAQQLGGSIILRSGKSTTTTATYASGEVLIQSAPSAVSGDVVLATGTASNGNSGEVHINAGYSLQNGNGGNINIIGGTSERLNGGAIEIKGGDTNSEDSL